MNFQNFILRNIRYILLLISVIFSISELYSSNRVTSVNAYQEGNNIVIEYKLIRGAGNVEVYLILNGKYIKLKNNVSGDVGNNISPGIKRIVWDVLKDYEDGFVSNNVRFYVSSSGKYNIYIPWENIIMANGGFSSLPDYTYGLTYARVKKAGFYFNAMTNFGFKFKSDYTFKEDTEVFGYPFTSGEKKYTRMSITAGALFRMGIPLYTYVGMGYGYRGLFYEAIDNKWFAVEGKHTVYHGITSEIGLIGNIKGFALSLGFSIITGIDGTYYPEAKVGLGYCFN